MPPGGKRAGAGRKPMLQEGRIADLVNASIDVTNRFLADETIPLERRAEIASRVACKRIPTDVNLGGQKDNPLGLQISIVRAVSAGAIDHTPNGGV